MTREECEKALETLKEYAMEMVEDESLDGEIFYEWYHLNEEELRQCTAPLEELIAEHFDNPPLKFEELKEGMFVWDNKKKCYLQCNPAISTEMAECVWYESFWYNDGKDYDEFYEDYLEFEENRFYRKQVEE